MKHRLAACGFFGQETPYLREWVEYHLLVGFDGFLMYCNDPDPTEAWEVLEPYRRQGLATLVHWPGRPAMRRQMAAYMQACKCRFAEHIAFVDLDEFIVPVGFNTVPELVAEFDYADGLVLNWRVFGTSGHVERQPLQTAAYTLGPSPEAYNHEWVKTILRPEKVVGIVDPHQFIFRDGGYCVDEMGEVHGRSSTRRPVTWSKGQVNHYITRSRSECVAKMAKWAANDATVERDDYLVEHDKCDGSDEAVLRFLPALIARMACQDR